MPIFKGPSLPLSPKKINDETVRTLARKVEVVADPELEALYDLKWPSIVEVCMRIGRSIRLAGIFPRENRSTR